MSGSERAVIYVDSGLSSLNSMTSSSSSPSHETHGKIKSSTTGHSMSSNYVIKIQIGEEGTYTHPVRIDIAGPHHHPHRQRQGIEAMTMTENDSLPMLHSSGHSSPRSDATPPPRFNATINGTRHAISLSRFGSETSESDTESDMSAEYSQSQPSITNSSPHHFGRGASMPGTSGDNMSLTLQHSSSSPAAQFGGREILGMGESLRESLEDETIYYNQDIVEGKATESVSNPKGNDLELSLGLSLKMNLNHCLIKAFNEHEMRKIQKTSTSFSTPLRPSHDLENSKLILSTPPSVREENGKESLSTHLSNYQFQLCKIPDSLPSGSSIDIDQSSFHVHEFQNEKYNHKIPNQRENGSTLTQEFNDTNSFINFAGYKDIFSRVVQEGPKQIKSDKGTIRGVRNRVRDGIATFLQSTDAKNFNEKEEGRVVVYVTSMGVVRDTYQRCQKVKNILRNLLIKFDERDCYMNQAVQAEIRDRIPMEERKKELLERPGLPSSSSLRHPSHMSHHHSQRRLFNLISLPQVFIEGQYLGGVDTIEKLNETGELRKVLQPYKNVSVLTTCENCGGFRMLPCPVCNGSKKSVHRNHFTEEFVALKCMHCDQAGLIKCHACNL